jgi:hypothetical protein
MISSRPSGPNSPNLISSQVITLIYGSWLANIPFLRKCESQYVRPRNCGTCTREAAHKRRLLSHTAVRTAWRVSNRIVIRGESFHHTNQRRRVHACLTALVPLSYVCGAGV